MAPATSAAAASGRPGTGDVPPPCLGHTLDHPMLPEVGRCRFRV